MITALQRAHERLLAKLPVRTVERVTYHVDKWTGKQITGNKGRAAGYRKRRIVRGKAIVLP